MNLHGRIMNLPCDVPDAAQNRAVRLAYKLGHKDARHAAAELVDELEQQRDELLAALIELLRVDDDWHGAVNSEMARARSKARAAIAKVEAA